MNEMDDISDSGPTVEDAINELLGRLSEGLVIAVKDGEVKAFKKFRGNGSGALNRYLVGLLQELLTRTSPANEV
jgi:hypothetical protein